jgi:pentatricopeptide repeat protein
MERQGVTPDLVAFNNALDALAKAGQYEKALRLFSDMEKRGFEPNHISFNTAIKV